MKKIFIGCLMIAIICLLIALTVHYFSPTTTSEITADGILEYIIGVLSFISTIVLSGLALWQSQKIQKGADESQSRMKKMTQDANDISSRMEKIATDANDISERMERITQDANEISRKMLELEEYNYRLNIRHFIKVGHFSMKSYGMCDMDNDSIWVEIQENVVGCAGKYPAIVLSVINTTNSVLTVEYEGATSEKVKWTNAQINAQSLKQIIRQGESKNIVFFAMDQFLQELQCKRVTLSFILENRFAQKYKEMFDLVFTMLYKDQNHNWHYLFHTQNFHIFRICLDEKGNEKEIPEEL